jgi:NADP-dependent 3-hydroxy acid dehydrogenase YdfG
MADSLQGRRIVITGASSGIGRATAEALAAQGARVAMGARRRERLEETAEKISASGGQAHAFAVDIGDEEAARAFLQDAGEAMGGVDTLINNAGVMLLGPVSGADTDEWRRMIDVNLLGLLYCTHAALPLMREAKGGHIVNVSSVAGRIAAAGSAVYNMTKWGVTGFSEGLRQEVLHSNIRVTCLEPGWVDTELQGHNENPVVVQAMEQQREKTGPILTAEDMAATIIFALSQPEHVNVNEILVRPTGQSR